ncbi:hypothetical protein HKD37_07G018985 [Glycine soja]
MQKFSCNLRAKHANTLSELKKRRCKELLMNSLSKTVWLSEHHPLSEIASSLSGWETLEEDKSEI